MCWIVGFILASVPPPFVFFLKFLLAVFLLLSSFLLFFFFLSSLDIDRPILLVLDKILCRMKYIAPAWRVILTESQMVVL